MSFGSQPVTTGFNYFGSFARVLCARSPKVLHKITNGETEVWAGPIYRADADSEGKTTINTTLGVLDVYWGLDSQQANDLLQSMMVDRGSGPEPVRIPAYKRICLYVARRIAFGNQVTPPVLKFHFEFDCDVLDISAHEINGDAVVPEVIYDLAVDRLYGAGLDSSYVDPVTHAACAEITIAEGVGASPDIDSRLTWRELFGRLFDYIDGHHVFKDGKIQMRLIRPATPTLTITHADMLEEPEPVNEQLEDSWNQTIVNFRDPDNKWEETPEPYEDPANRDLQEQQVSREFSFPWITKRSVAYQVAKRKGVRGGLPSMPWRLTLKPKWRTLYPGDVVYLDYSILGVSQRILRIRNVERGGPNDRQVKIEAIEEIARDSSHDYVPDHPSYQIPGTLDPNGGGEFAVTSTVPRLSWLPTDLKDGKADGFLVAMRRPDKTVIRGRVWWTFDPGQQEYSPFDEVSAFPAAGQLLCWHQIRTDHWLLRANMEGAHDRDWLQTLVSENRELYAVVAIRLYKTVGTPKDEHQVMASWLQWPTGGRFVLLGDNLVDIEVTGEAFSTLNLALEGLATDGHYPALYVYFGRREDFFIHTSDSINFDRDAVNSLGDTEKVRYIKASLANVKNEEDLADVDARTFDRDDNTMCADGTYSEEWGAASPTTYQLFDEQGGLQALLQTAPDYAKLADIDAALGAVYDGTATADQILLVEEIDIVLGVVAETNQGYYAP